MQLTLWPDMAPANNVSEILRFVVKLHDATRRHIDLRLEFERRLLSWALNDGLPLKPGQKRRATMVQDHALSRMLFEGVIPAPRRGAGEVIVSDTGIFAPTVDGQPVEGRARSLAAIRSALQVGRMEFVLHGEKLTGAWVLERVWQSDRGNEGSKWVLTKHPAGAAGTVCAAPELNRSVLSNRTLEDLKRHPHRPD